MEIRLNDALSELLKSEVELKIRKAAIRDAAIREFRKMIQMLDLKPTDLFDTCEVGSANTDRKRFVYVNPDNPKQTCSNLGRKPAWFTKLREEGREIPTIK